METKFYIEATAVSPEINFDLTQSSFVIKGRSMPENAEKFYLPVMAWLIDNIGSKPMNANFDIALDYYNTGSFIRLMGLFNTLQELNESGSEFRVRWLCESDDEDNIDDGQSFKEVVKVPFDIIEL